MSDQIGSFGIAITADDKTEKGAKSAEKRLSKVGTRVSDVNRRAAIEAERTTLRTSKSIIGSMGKVEQATARALGGRSLTSGLSARLGAVGDAASAMGSGMADAAASGGVLAGAAGVVTMAVGATVAVMAAAAYGAFKLADGWAKGAAQIGRMAEIIGVGTKQLQEFNAAAERVGVDKGTASGTLGSMSQTLNDARYGRNVQALEALRRLGVKMVTNADGTVNVGAMLPTIADALRRQNSSGRRTAARYLGIPEGALPVFTQGGQALSADMADADKHAAVLSDADIAMGMRVARKGVRVGQLKDRLVSKAGRATASTLEPGFDAVLEGSQRFSEAVDDGFRPAVREFKNAIQSLKQLGVSPIGSARAATPFHGSLASRIEHLGERSQQWQVSPKGARGVMQIMPGTARHIAENMLGQPFDPVRYRKDPAYSRLLGQTYLDWLSKRYGGNEVLASAAYNAGEGAVDHWISGTAYKDSRGRKLRYRLGDPRTGQISDAEWAARIPYKETRDYVHRVVVELKNAPKGTRATVHSTGGGISHAMAN